ncbi:MAG: Oxidoreductase [Flavipsychrobacter sp.]|jgi:photosystem II stability/assembly factor-like uncharacterized protein|nr:Oxidoreductase [Flavipsychrobacter sp.]
MRIYLILLLFIVSTQLYSQDVRWQAITPQTDASFRGLSVVDDSVAWVSGSKGWVGRSINGGKDWTFTQVKGFEKNDFRSLYAFDANNAIIANAGSPAYIMRTTDGGKNWKIVYQNNDTSAFIDGVDFWNNKEGIIYGDPINGRMMILKTKDGGRIWQALSENSRPMLMEGEASFAASGTNIHCYGKDKVAIATGGKISRLFLSSDRGASWIIDTPPIIHGESTTGIFSFDFSSDITGIIVGGDYKKDTLKRDHIFYTHDGGKQWLTPVTPTRGYRECVAKINNIMLASGPSGTDISYDGGANWKALSDEKGFHVVKKSRTGNLLVIAGSSGKISLLKFE